MPTDSKHIATLALLLAHAQHPEHTWAVMLMGPHTYYVARRKFGEYFIRNVDWNNGLQLLEPIVEPSYLTPTRGQVVMELKKRTHRRQANVR